MQKYNNADLSVPGEINNTDINKVNLDTSNYMNAAAQNVDMRLGSGIRLRPGVEMTIKAIW